MIIIINNIPRENIRSIFPLRLRMKIASKIEDEHKIVKDMPPPTEAVAKMTGKTLPGKARML